VARRPTSVALVLPGLLLAMLLGALDQTITAPALPSMADDLGGLEQIPEVVTAYLVAATVVMPVYGKLGDRFGRKPVMQTAIGAFVVGAVLCGSATSMPQLIAFRALQGMGGGGLMIGPQAIIGEIVSPRERGRYLGLIGATYILAAVGGPLLGGLFIDQSPGGGSLRSTLRSGRSPSSSSRSRCRCPSRPRGRRSTTPERSGWPPRSWESSCWGSRATPRCSW
jgi:MFS family permease